MKIKRVPRISYSVPVPLLCLLFLLGCSIGPERKEKTTNDSAKVEVLFIDADGYTVKRFYDNTDWRYYVTPAGGEMIERPPKLRNDD